MATTIEGVAVWRGDREYERTRQHMLWNGRKPPRFPEVIVRAATERDVVAGVELARARGLRVAVRAGGHSWVGSPLRDDSVLIDLSALDGVSVDEETRTASVQPAVTSSGLASALAPRGLAFPIGHCPSVGISGFLLSGGLGWNSGAWGPACLRVQAVDVVTADGDLVQADEERNPELLWAARGAGPGFFGVVTRFELGLEPLPGAITTSTYVYRVSELEAVSRWATDVVASLHPAVELTLLLAPAPADVAADGRGKALVVTATAFADSAEEAARWLAPLESSPALARALSRRVNEPTPFDVLFRDFGGRWPEGRRYAADNVWTDGDYAETLLRLRRHVVDAPSPESFAFAVMAPPEPEDAPPLPDMAFSMVARSFVSTYAIWEHERDDAANVRWLRDTIAEVEPLAVGHYVGEADLLSGEPRARRSYARPNWERLEELRRQYDPGGLFHSYLGAGEEPDD